jgi:hypothetical protein
VAHWVRTGPENQAGPEARRFDPFTFCKIPDGREVTVKGRTARDRKLNRYLTRLYETRPDSVAPPCLERWHNRRAVRQYARIRNSIRRQARTGAIPSTTENTAM